MGSFPDKGADGRPWPSFAEGVKVWTRIALLSFGGPAGQIAVMHRILVEEKRWLSESRFLHALNFCMLLPGPEAQQLTVYAGWLLHRVWGGIVAGLLFVLPGMLAIMALSIIYALYGQVGIVAAVFFGLKAAVLAIVLQALIRLGSRTLSHSIRLALAIGAFVAIFFFAVPFPVIVFGAGVIGYVAGRTGHAAFADSGHKATGGPDAASLLGDDDHETAATFNGTLAVAVSFLILWLAPVAALLLYFGAEHPFSQIALFFSKMAVVTFGGAYAVLAYVAQAAVGEYGWLAPGEMLDGLGMAETTPGPLIMVTQFVGFMGAFRDPAGLSPLTAGIIGGLLTVWVTFAPCFLWIFLGAPFVERLRGNRALAGALSAITAAVVGVIGNLAVWFALHVLFEDVGSYAKFGLKVAVPRLNSLDPIALILVLAALAAVFRFKIGIAVLLAAAGGLGICLHLVVLI